MRTPEFIQRCMDSGLTLEMALRAAKAFEAECELAVAEVIEARRAKERARQAKHRSKDNVCHVMSRDVTLPSVTERDLTYAGAPVVIPFSSSLRSEEVGVGGVGASERVPPTDDWPEGKVSDHAEMLEQAVASPWLDRNKSPDLVTTRGRIAAWKRDGASWEHDVLPVVIGLCANRRSKVASWKFFDDAICRSIAENRAALEIPEAAQRRQSTGPPSFMDTVAAEHAEARRRVLES